ncbi:MAG: S41 family peptidase [candidate division Zixibacteria bacterium]|nr:S41 family peptidase [candidate division Zixibacteria bacterium]
MINKPSLNKLGILTGPIFLLCLAVGFAWASDDDLYSFIRLFDKIAITVSDRYVLPLDPEKMINSSIKGMMKDLDKYSRYLSDQDYYYLMKETQGEYIGIGIELEEHSDTVWVSSVIEGSPAAASNVRVGDRIIKVDSLDAVGLSASECRDLLRGDKDSRVFINFWRPLFSKHIEIEFTRENIHIEPVPCWCIDSYNNGYIKITRFSEGTALEVESLISLLMDKGISGLIIDLQNNPGGLLYEAVELASIFLNEDDKIVETRGRGSAALRTYKVREGGIYNKGPLVIVIDDQTASAAEIVAGAIQDHDRGLIVGSTSYGKGLVQQIMQFDDNSALKLTTAKYYTPSNRCIQKDTSLSNLAKPENSDRNILFYTKSGRPVFGGGGIIPDIYIDRLETPPFLDDINTLGYVTDFVAEYGPKLDIDENFVVSDDIVSLFIGYIEKKKYVYRNPEFSAFDQFVDQNKDWLNKDNLSGYVDDIKKILEKKSDKEMLTLHSQIKDILYESFITQGLGKRKAYELVWLKTHPELIKAGMVLGNPQTYDNLLANY